MQSVSLFLIINPSTLNPEWIGETASKRSLKKKASVRLKFGRLMVWEGNFSIHHGSLLLYRFVLSA